MTPSLCKKYSACGQSAHTFIAFIFDKNSTLRFSMSSLNSNSIEYLSVFWEYVIIHILIFGMGIHMKFLENILWFSKEYGDNDISAHSAQVSFFVMISIFPFVLLLITLIQYLPIDQLTIFQFVEKITPASLSPTITSWVNEIYKHSASAVVSVTLISTLWASSKGFLGISAGIRKIYRNDMKPNFILARLLAIVYTLAFSVMIAISLVILVYGNTLFTIINNHIPYIGEIFNTIFPFRVLIGFSIFVLFFVLIFTFIPGRGTRMRTQIPGALITSILWIVFSYLYSIYIDYFSNMSSLYGSLTYIVAFMLWLYFCINFIFLGAEVNVFLLKHSSQDNNKQ